VKRIGGQYSSIIPKADKKADRHILKHVGVYPSVAELIAQLWIDKMDLTKGLGA